MKGHTLQIGKESMPGMAGRLLQRVNTFNKHRFADIKLAFSLIYGWCVAKQVSNKEFQYILTNMDWMEDGDKHE